MFDLFFGHSILCPDLVSVSIINLKSNEDNDFYKNSET